MADHPQLAVDDFEQFFLSIYGHSPFRWQTRLANQVCNGEWPRYIKLPTSSGKTSCIDIAVFALAYQAWRRHTTGQPIDVPRRIFFVVDRRIIVNEAYRRAQQLKDKLLAIVDQPNRPEYPVAWWLRNLTGNDQAPPLDCYELRGGIYRDDAWVRSLLQPTIVTSTVDQFGSRILFRGYGVSDRNLPIHAALTANDALILLDEAHCSNPFSQTLSAIARYRDSDAGNPPRWAEQPLHTPFRFIEMTATPPDDINESGIFQIDKADYQVDKSLADRHHCHKFIRLVESKAKGGKQNLMLAKDLVKQAKSLAEGDDGEPRCKRIAIVVNRIECAREAYKLLQEDDADRVELMIGRMRPIDRDRLTKKLQARFQSGSTEELSEPHFVVATQCLEVGADFDFDGMVSQCASLDALRQRFGRLNRLGMTGHSRGAVVMGEGDKAPRKPDPIYGAALPATWEWLQQHVHEEVIDFGVRSLETILDESRKSSPEIWNNLKVEAIHAPVLMPAHLDLLCQTAPRPALEPEIAPFLHGPNRGVPEVRVCWRADLPDRSAEDANELGVWLQACQQTLAVCPPSSAECLSVPLPLFTAWLRGEDETYNDDCGDVPGETDLEEPEFSRFRRPNSPHRRQGVIWNSSGCIPTSIEKISPNALIVLPATAGGWIWLGHFPDAPTEPEVHLAGTRRQFTKEEFQQLARIDEGSAGFQQARDRPILRVHRQLVTSSADTKALAGLWKFLENKDARWEATFLSNFESEDDDQQAPAPQEDETPETPESEFTAFLRDTRARLAETPARRELQVNRYPNGYTVVGPRLVTRETLPRASFDDELDEHNLEASGRIALINHLADVAAETRRLVASIDLPISLGDALVAAAERHDLGKADLRFQAMLLNSTIDVAAMQPKLWAKSATGAVAHVNATTSSLTPGADPLPKGFRHEMLSVELAQKVTDTLDAEARMAMLHFIAAHHGHARPFAPVVIDEAPPDVHLRLGTTGSVGEPEVVLSMTERIQCPAHRLDSGISDRFWKLNRRYGWWGLAGLESTLRLADWVASSQPLSHPLTPLLQPAKGDAARRDAAVGVVSNENAIGGTAKRLRMNCVGLNGANPLGFLAALGLFRHISINLDASMRMQWKIADGTWSPVFIGAHPALSNEDALLDWLTESLSLDSGEHWLKQLNELPDESRALTRPSAYSQAANDASKNHRCKADWLSCNGSDLCEASSNSQLQTARRDYFPESVAAVIDATTRQHLARTLFQQWDYADPIQKVSLHLEPREDRRHAYQWHRPVGDPTRSLHGGMIGANRLAMEAWPLFQSVAVRGELQTIGFRGTRPMKGIYWTWPLWIVPMVLSDVTPVLNFKELQIKTDSSAPGRTSGCEILRGRGISLAFRLRRILVEKTPNFTSPMAIFAASVEN